MWMLLWESILAMAATFGFAVLFNAPARALPVCAIAGGTVFVVRQLLMGAGASQEAATLASAVVLGLIGELSARCFHVPAIVFKVTGFIPLIPGVLAYHTVFEIFNADYLQGLVNGLRTLLIAGAIAGGIGVVTALFRLNRDTTIRSR